MYEFQVQGRRSLFCLLGVGVALVAGEAARSCAAAKGPPDFDRFFEEFRIAVLAGRRDEVVRMVAFPFTDFREGRYCEEGSAVCHIQPDSLTSRNAAEFQAKYDRIFPAAVVAAIRDRRLRRYQGSEDDEVAGPIQEGEVLLDLEDVGQQRVFGVRGSAYKLLRVPFYS